MAVTPEAPPQPGDALLIVDVQNDFLPNGSLAVPDGDAVVVPLNWMIRRFHADLLPIYASRDWHPANHCSFRKNGGAWPPHCVAGTYGAAFAPTLALPNDTIVISKAVQPDVESYSAFAGTSLADRLRRQSIQRLFVGGLATDYCVLNTVHDALTEGFAVLVIQEAIRAVDLKPGDGARAIATMCAEGAELI